MVDKTYLKMKIKNSKKRFELFSNRLEYFKYFKEFFLYSFKSDPLANFMILRLKLSPLKGMVMAFLLTISVYFIGYMLLLITKYPVVGITQTYLDFFYDIVVIPIVFASYLWMSTAPSYTLFRIGQVQEKIEGEMEFPIIISDLFKKLNNKLIFLFGLGTALFLGFNCLFCVSGKFGSFIGGRLNINFFYYIKIPVLWFISWYVVAVIVVKVFVFVTALRKILDKIVLDTDESSIHDLKILKPVKDFLKTLTYFFGVCGYGLIMIVVRGNYYGYFNHKWVIYTGVILYVFTISFIFFSPLHPFFHLLKRAGKKVFDNKGILKIQIPFKIFPIDLLRNFFLSCCIPPLFILIFTISS